MRRRSGQREQHAIAARHMPGIVALSALVTRGHAVTSKAVPAEELSIAGRRVQLTRGVAARWTRTPRARGNLIRKRGCVYGGVAAENEDARAVAGRTAAHCIEEGINDVLDLRHRDAFLRGGRETLCRFDPHGPAEYGPSSGRARC
jgi:hypothetical protein